MKQFFLPLLVAACAATATEPADTPYRVNLAEVSLIYNYPQAQEQYPETQSNNLYISLKIKGAQEAMRKLISVHEDTGGIRLVDSTGKEVEFVGSCSHSNSVALFAGLPQGNSATVSGTLLLNLCEQEIVTESPALNPADNPGFVDGEYTFSVSVVQEEESERPTIRVTYESENSTDMGDIVITDAQGKELESLGYSSSVSDTDATIDQHVKKIPEAIKIRWTRRPITKTIRLPFCIRFSVCGELAPKKGQL